MTTKVFASGTLAPLAQAQTPASGSATLGDKQISIVGRMRMEERAQLSDLRSLYVFSGQGTPPVPVDHVATTSLEPVASKTKRFDQYRTVTVQCWPTEGHLASEVISAAMPALKELQKQLPDGFIFRFAGEQKEQVSGFGRFCQLRAAAGSSSGVRRI